MTNTIAQPTTIELTELKNLFIELTAKNCNQRCKTCYIEFPQFSKKINDFIKLDLIKKSLQELDSQKLDCIYLSGAEPMTHPDFNAILRYCLKYASVCICTNGSFINEKKARFLKKVEDESNNEIIIKLSLSHFDEIENDNLRYRGAYRHTIFAIKHLLKYNFNPIISYMNYNKLAHEIIYENLLENFKQYNFDLDKSNILITNYHSSTITNNEININKNTKLDCMTSRILTTNGIYTCPFLGNDYRGRSGSNFCDYSKKSSLETSFCKTCCESDIGMFTIDYSKFE